MPPKKTLSKVERENIELKARLDMAESGNRWAAFTPVIHTAIVTAGTVFIFYYIYLMVDSLAGKTTFAYIFTNIIANIYIQTAISMSLAAGGVGYGVYQKRQEKKTRERLHKRIKELETGADPARTTSGLTTRGETNPIDR